MPLTVRRRVIVYFPVQVYELLTTKGRLLGSAHGDPNTTSFSQCWCCRRLPFARPSTLLGEFSSDRYELEQLLGIEWGPDPPNSACSMSSLPNEVDSNLEGVGETYMGVCFEPVEPRKTTVHLSVES